MAYNSIMVMVTKHSECTKTHKLVYFRAVSECINGFININFMLCEFYLDF